MTGVWLRGVWVTSDEIDAAIIATCLRPDNTTDLQVVLHESLREICSASRNEVIISIAVLDKRTALVYYGCKEVTDVPNNMEINRNRRDWTRRIQL